jgi:hypothetical protein
MQRQVPTYDNKLSEALLNLSKTAIDKIIAHRNNGNLEAVPYQLLPVASIDFLMRSYQFDWNNIEYFDFYKWRDADFENFIQNELENIPEFETAAKQVTNEFEVPEEAVKKIGLSRLLRLIMEEAPNGRITHENITTYVQHFIDGYESERSHIPIVWNVDLWLNNIYIETEEIEIEKGVYLKRPTKNQLAEVRPKTNDISEFDKMMGRFLYAGAILSFSVSAVKKPVIEYYPEKITQQIERWLNLFRLLKPTDLTIVYQTITPVSIFEYSFSEKKEQPQDKFWQGKVDYTETSRFKLFLKKDEEELLRTFFKNLKPALKDISHKNYLSGSNYDLAFHRYADSLVKSEVNAYKILSAMTSLEALLSDGSTEITFKIRLRVGKLLSYFGFKALDVSENIKTAYSLRSKLVHGSNLEEQNRDLLDFARQHTHEIINYNRICLLIALQLKKSIDKQKLIKEIDNSLIDKVADDELNKIISAKVKIPILNPFVLHQKNH